MSLWGLVEHSGRTLWPRAAKGKLTMLRGGGGGFAEVLAAVLRGDTPGDVADAHTALRRPGR